MTIGIKYKEVAKLQAEDQHDLYVKNQLDEKEEGPRMIILILSYPPRPGDSAHIGMYNALPFNIWL